MATTNKKRYSLIFQGKIKDGFDTDTVKENLKKFFNNNSESVERLFSKETTILKKNLTKVEVEKYKTVLEASGAQCSIRETIEKTKPAIPQKEKEDPVSHKVDDLLTVTRFLVKVISFNQKLMWVLLILVVLSLILWTKLYFDIQNMTAIPVANELPDTKCIKKIDFSSKNDSENYIATGLSGFEPWGRWSDGKLVTLKFKLPKTDCDYSKVSFTVKGFVAKKHPEQSAKVTINGVDYGKIKIKLGQSNPRILVFGMPSGLFKQDDVNVIKFNINSPMSLKELGQGNDQRTLGLGFQSVVFQ